jgi:glycosyltransferase involved in cell wall biosynthesis
MRIHFFLRTLNETTGGGSHYNSLAYMRALREHGHEITVHVLYDRGNSFPDDFIPIVHEGFGKGHLGERSLLRDLLLKYQEDADLYFLYAVEFAWGGGFYRRTGGVIPCVVYMDAYLSSMRTTHEQKFSMKWYQYKRLLWDKTMGLIDVKHIDRFLPCSPYIGQMYMNYGFPKDRFTVLPNIVPNTVEPREHQDHDPLTVLYVGRLVYVKGIDLAIEAVARLKSLPFKLLIVGDGDMRATIEKRIEKEGLPIEIVGWVPEKEVNTYFEKADLFIHPARWPDPAPRTIVACTQHGLPTIIPDTGGSSWIAGDSGLVYKTGDVDELTNAFRTLLESPELRRKLSAYGPKQAKRFELSEVYPQIENILKIVADDIK